MSIFKKIFFFVSGLGPYLISLWKLQFAGWLVHTFYWEVYWWETVFILIGKKYQQKPLIILINTLKEGSYSWWTHARAQQGLPHPQMVLCSIALHYSSACACHFHARMLLLRIVITLVGGHTHVFNPDSQTHKWWCAPLLCILAQLLLFTSMLVRASFLSNQFPDCC